MKICLLLNKNDIINESYIDYFKISNINFTTELTKNSDYIFNINENIIFNKKNIINIINNINDINEINDTENIIINKFDYNNPQIKWIIPIKKKITIIKKNEIINKSNNINIIYYNNQYKNIEDIINIFINSFEDFNEINFYIINKEHNIINNKKYNNIYINDNDNEDLLIKCHYILIYNNNNDIKPLILGFNYGCQLIINKKECINYNIKSNIILEKKIKLKLKPSLEILYNEINELLNHRNTVIDNIINYKLPNTGNNLIFHLICQKYNLNLPNIFIQTFMSKIDNIETLNKNFRDIYLINKINLIDINLLENNFKLTILNDEMDIENIIYNLNESILFNLTYCEKLCDIINIISYRNFKDIIILNNTVNKDLIKKNFNNFYYIYEYDNLLILITL